MEDAYSSFVRLCVEGTKRLDIFAACAHSRETAIKRTWTPDSVSLNRLEILEDDLRVADPDRPSTYPKTTFTYNVSDSTKCEARFATNLSSITVSRFMWEEIWKIPAPFIEYWKNWESNTEAEDAFRRHCQHFRAEMTELSCIHGTYDRVTDFDELILQVLLLSRERVRDGLDFTKPCLGIFKDWMTLKDHLLETGDAPSAKALLTVESSNSTEPSWSKEESLFVSMPDLSLVSELKRIRLIGPRFGSFCAPVEIDICCENFDYS